jgi:hypothetical protein
MLHAALHTVLFVHGYLAGIEILQGRSQHGEKVGYCYPSRLEKTLCKCNIYVPLVTKGLKKETVPVYSRKDNFNTNHRH